MVQLCCWEARHRVCVSPLTAPPAIIKALDWDPVEEGGPRSPYPLLPPLPPGLAVYPYRQLVVCPSQEALGHKPLVTQPGQRGQTQTIGDSVVRRNGLPSGRDHYKNNTCEVGFLENTLGEGNANDTSLF